MNITKAELDSDQTMVKKNIASMNLNAAAVAGGDYSMDLEIYIKEIE